MITKEQWRTFIDHPVVEWTIFVVGLLLLFVVAPLVGAIPGPGGVLVAGVGLAMVLKTSMWAKRRYVRSSAGSPRPAAGPTGRLRRRSARRRLKRQKEREAREGAMAANATPRPRPAAYSARDVGRPRRPGHHDRTTN